LTHLKSSFDTIALEFIHFCFTLVIQPDIPTNTAEELCDGLVTRSQVMTQAVQSTSHLEHTRSNRKWWPQSKQRLRGMEQQVLQLGGLYPPIHDFLSCDFFSCDFLSVNRGAYWIFILQSILKQPLACKCEVFLNFLLHVLYKIKISRNTLDRNTPHWSCKEYEKLTCWFEVTTIKDWHK
jgi:hypothetical protein